MHIDAAIARDNAEAGFDMALTLEMATRFPSASIASMVALKSWPPAPKTIRSPTLAPFTSTPFSQRRWLLLVTIPQRLQ
jgi:hypothetical protein